MAPGLPIPVLFHPLKHHLHYIREFINSQYHSNEAELKLRLKTIGSSQLDLYLGPLAAQQIAKETILYLQRHNVLEREAYLQHLATGGADYRVITLSDSSSWVLRWGVVAERHVHLHPARYSLNTTRVKANLLKTAIAVSLALKRAGITEAGLPLINQVRTQWLELAPLKQYHPTEGLGKLIRMLTV